MGRATPRIYGFVCYLIFLATFLYLVGFVGNLLVPKSIASGLATDFPSSLRYNSKHATLREYYGEIYETYRRRVSMIIPLPGGYFSAPADSDKK